MKDPFAWLAAKICRRPWIAVAFWIVLIIALVPRFAPNAAAELKGGGITIDNTESTNADAILDSQFDLSSQKNLVALFHSSTSTVDDASFKDQVTTAAKDIAAIDGVKKVTNFYDSKLDSLAAKDRHATLVLIVPTGTPDKVEQLLPKIRGALKPVTLDHYVIGSPAASVDSQAAAAEDLHRAELVTAPLIVILLLIVFRTVIAALIPLVLGGISIILTIAYLGVLGAHTNISIFALNVGSMIGLGLAIDYSLIILTRFREELADGHPPERAVVITMASAGRSVAYSAITVVLAMAAITVILAPIEVIRSISLAVLLVAIQAALLAMTMLPAMMALLKHRIEWLRLIPKPKEPRPGEVGVWYRFSQFVMRRPWVFLLVSLAALLAIGSPIYGIAFGSPTPPNGTEVANGTAVAQSEFPGGRLAPLYVVVHSGSNEGVFNPNLLNGVRELTKKIAADPRVSDVSSLSTSFSSLSDDKFAALTKGTLGAQSAAAAPFVNLNGNSDSTVITVVSKYLDSTPDTDRLLADIRATTVPSVSQLKGTTVYVGGSTAVIHDFKTSLFDRFPLVVGAVALIIFVILMMFFQSVALPIKAILLNLLSIGATFGILSLIFQHGLADAQLGFTSSLYITVITPGILYVILFALSTDYEVFMLSRVKEYFQKTGNNKEAVAAGLQHTAGIITAAGLILVLTFGSFVVSNTVVLKEIGLGLAFGVLLDSSIVRIVMVPASMRLLGNGNWYMPAWLKRIVPEISEEGGREITDYSVPVAAPPGATAGTPAGAGATMAMPTMPAAGPPPPPVLGPASLVVSGQWDGVPVIPLRQDRPLRFGRNDSNEVRLRNLAISRWHARIDYVDGQYRLKDMGSVNGVYVNGVRIQPEPATTILRPGDFMVIGGFPQVAFIFKVDPPR
jgi:RND superfamily putative drug exporter